MDEQLNDGDGKDEKHKKISSSMGVAGRNSLAEGSILDRLKHFSSSNNIDFSDSGDDEEDNISGDSDFQQDAVLPRVLDHFSLTTKSSLVRSRKHHEGVRVFQPSFSHQVVIEETLLEGDMGLKLEFKTMSDVTAGHKCLNSFYAIIAALFAGILLLFFIQMLLHVVLNLAAQAGVTEKDPHLRVGNLLGTIFALVSFSHYFSEALVIAGRFIVDCYTDQTLAKSLFRKRGYLVVEWCFAVCFLLIPSVVGMVTLTMQNDEWWMLTSTTWFFLVMGFFGLFSFSVVYYEIRAAYSLVASRMNARSFIDVMKHCILLRQRRSYSGQIFTTALARNIFSNSLDSTRNSLRFNLYEQSKRVSTPIWTRLVKLMPKFLFKDLSDEPKEIYTIDDVNDYRPFLTHHNWSLERVFCRPRHSRYVAVVSGPGALTKGQMRSSVLCAALYFVLVAYLVVSILIWFHASVGVILIFLAVLLLFNYRSVLDTYALIKLGRDLIAVKMTKKLKRTRKTTRDSQSTIANVPREHVEGVADDNFPRDDLDGGSNSIDRRHSARQLQSNRTTEASEAVYHVLTIERVREAKAGLCWFCFAVELGIMFVWPTVTLFLFKPSFGGFFLFASIISNCRWYCNVVTAIQESGNMDAVGGQTDEEVWGNKARLNQIVVNISSNPSYKWWRILVAILGFAFIAIFLWAFSGGVIQSNPRILTYLPPADFHYPAVINDMRYPSCRMSSLDGHFGGNTSALLDYTFLARMPYLQNERLRYELDTWFHQVPGAKDLQEIVDDFRAREDPNDEVAVTLKLVSIPDPATNETTAVILIRGTVNQFDMLTNFELWGAAAFMQLLRFIIPLGEIWSPIYRETVKWTSKFASRSLERVSYYKLTTKLAEELKQNELFDRVHVTGHSLGGGLALITGAQADIQAIGVSAPNALISGAGFDPPISEEELNKYTFNVVPDRDFIPRLDDIADEFQRIRCTADSNYAFTMKCHSIYRATCEIMYTCGSGNRPVFCECVERYGYPEPVAAKDLNYTFSEFCADAQG